MAVAICAPRATFAPSAAEMSMKGSSEVSTVSSRRMMPFALPPTEKSAATASAVTVVWCSECQA